MEKKFEFGKISIYRLGFIERLSVIFNYNLMKKSLIKDYIKNSSSKDYLDLLKKEFNKGYKGIYMVRLVNKAILFDRKDLRLFKKKYTDVDSAFLKTSEYLIQNLTYEKFCQTENAIYLIQLFSELDNYLFKCFKYILLKQPSLLGDQTIKIKELIEKKGDIEGILESLAEKQASKKFDLDVLLDDIIERKIHNKFYKGYKEVCKYAVKKLGLNMDHHEDAGMCVNLDDIIIDVDVLKQIRNLYAHGDGTINSIFLSRLKKLKNTDWNLKLGEKYSIEDGNIQFAILIINIFIVCFDHALLESHPELLFKR